MKPLLSGIAAFAGKLGRRLQSRTAMFFSPGLITFGLILAGIGLLVELAPWLRLGRFPGDISFGSGNVRVYVPIMTSLVLSVVLSLILSLFSRH